jgi:hypothetical protein
VPSKLSFNPNSSGIATSLEPSEFELLPEAFFVLDPGLRVLESNSRYQNLFRLSKEELVNRSYFSESHQDNSLTQAFQEALLHRQKSVVENFDTSLGKWLEYRISPCDVGVGVLVADISERKNLESTFQQELKRAATTLETAPAGMARIDLDGHWEFMNEHGLSLLGLSLEQLRSLTFDDLCPSLEARNSHHEFLTLIENNSGPLSQERTMVRANGSQFWVEFKLSVARDSDGHPLYFIAIFDCITGRKDIEESLRFALEAAGIANWDYDAINDSTRRSPLFDKIFGYTECRDQWGYVDFHRCIHPEDIELFDRSFRAALAKGEDFDVQVRIQLSDQSLRWVSLKGRVYLNSDGHAIRMAGVVIDITHDKIVETELQSAKLYAEDANREKSYFLANMSHEIRTPLGAILGFTDMLKDPNLTEQDRAKYIKIINRNGRNLSNLIDEILDLSKVEAGQLTIESISASVEEVTESVIELLRLKTEKRGIALRLRVPKTPLPRVLTDPVRLRQILLNVIGNAVKFTHKGMVTVTIKSVPAADCKGELITFTVTDTGVGMSIDACKTLFQPFTQADSSTSRKYGGTGLGLALSRRLARAMKGDLVLESTSIGVGSTFVITIPQVNAPEIQPSSEETLAPRLESIGSLEGLKILIAEDAEDNQTYLEIILRRKGAIIDIVEDGQSALEKVYSNHYDLILMDMQMPRLDGYAATTELRRNGFKLPIIALTAHAMRHDRDKCLHAGCSDYVSKPIDSAILFGVIEKHTRANSGKNLDA